MKNNIATLPVVEVTKRAQWRAWLKKHADTSSSIWLVTYKKASGNRYVSYDDVVEEALCFGWIDSTARALDEERSMLLMAPRKTKSVWSLPNKKRVEKLIAAGLMTCRGLEKIEAAKADGSWDALNDSDAGVLSKDLVEAFDLAPGARKNFEAFPPGARRVILGWIYSAKRPETRAVRIEQIVAAAGRNERVR